ncbi:MAG: MarR family transcriptional regulator [Proteobacteria bacterium]|nr:MarR family transcriptional regulator [Pseudomonadota bacterium]
MKQLHLKLICIINKIMEFSDELKSFPPLMVALLHRLLTEEFDRRCQRRLKLERQDWLVILMIGKGSQITATALAQATGIHKSKLSRMVLRLETKRVIRRQPLSVDRRFEGLVLTNSGVATYRSLLREVQFFNSRCSALHDDLDAWTVTSAQWLNSASILKDFDQVN